MRQFSRDNVEWFVPSKAVMPVARDYLQVQSTATVVQTATRYYEEFTWASARYYSSLALEIHHFCVWLTTINIRMPSVGRVKNYLLLHGDMLDIVQTVLEETRKKFYPDYEISLEVKTDPEIGSQGLVVFVRKDSYPENIFEQIEQIDDSYQSLLSNKSGYIFATTDFQPPRNGR